MILIQEGSSYNIPLKTYYIEDESELENSILTDAPAGTVVEINEINNFHVKVKRSDGSWTEL